MSDFVQRFWPNFWTGFRAPFEALKLILRSPRMLGLTAVPLALNIFLYLLYFYYGAHWLRQTIDSWAQLPTHWVPAWAVTTMAFFFQVLGWLALAVAAALSFTVVSGVLSAPFNDALCRAALKAKGHELSANSHQHGFSQIIRLEAKRMVVLLLGALIILILGIIPFLQLPALMLGAGLVSFEYFGYPMSQHHRTLWPVARFVVRHPMVSLGFGSFLLLMMALPLASIIYIPLAVVGGSLLYADLQKN